MDGTWPRERGGPAAERWVGDLPALLRGESALDGVWGAHSLGWPGARDRGWVGSRAAGRLPADRVEGGEVSPLVDGDARDGGGGAPGDRISPRLPVGRECGAGHACQDRQSDHTSPDDGGGRPRAERALLSLIGDDQHRGKDPIQFLFDVGELCPVPSGDLRPVEQLGASLCLVQ